MISPKTTIITLIVAVAAVCAAVFTSGADLQTRTGAGVPMLTAEQLPTDGVTRVILARRGEPQLVFQRSQRGGWVQTEPFAYPMDPAAMRAVAAAAREVMIVDRVPAADFQDDLSLSTLGLDPPAASLTFDSPNGPLRIDLGRRGIAGRAYARLNESGDVLVVTQELHDRAVDMSAKEWRDRLLFRNVGVECDRIERFDGTTRLVLERDRRTWRMLEPVETRVDTEALERFMQALGGSRSAGFIADQLTADALTRFGLASVGAGPSITVTCTTAEAGGEDIIRTEHAQTLMIGNPAGAGTHDRFGMVAGRPAVVRVPAAALQVLFINPVELMDPTGSGAIAADVRSLRIMTSTGEVRFERDLDRWRAPDYENREVPAALVQDLLAKLTEFRAPGIEVREYPHELETAVVTFFGFDGRPMDTVRVLHHEGTGQWALENGDNVLRVFPGGFELGLTAADYGLQ